MRLVNIFLMMILLVFGGFIVWQYNNSLGETIDSWIHGNNDIVTIEARYTPEQILSISKKKLVENDSISSADPSLFFRPYLVMHVKFPGNDGKLEKGVLLWSLVDGEAVINGDTWEMTSGFETITKHASTEDEFKLLEAISHNGGSIAKNDLQKRFKIDENRLNKLVSDAKEKHLILEKDGRYILSFNHSKIDIAPQTHFSEPLVTKVYSHALREEASYDHHQIEAVAASAFGNSFSVEETQQVYLPVYAIEIRNKNDKISETTYWNGVTGKQLPK